MSDAPCSCHAPVAAPAITIDPDPFGEQLAASMLAAAREPNRAARRAARQGHRARRALQAAAMEPLDAPFPVPAYPPREWFEGPPTWVEPWRAAAGLKSADDGGILRLTITDEGRIGGWFFNAGQCLVHDPAACPKHSPTRYAAFHQSDVLCADGTMLDVGVIGMTHGHQSPWLDWKEAQRLYADPTAQKILCVAGDDPRGGWIAGAVVPGTTYGDVAMMRRSGLSGDWRPMPQSWWAEHGISSSEIRQVEGYDCIGPTLVTRPALPLVRNFSMDGRAAAILGGSAGIELDVSRFSRRDRERISILAALDEGVSRFARRAYAEWDPELHPRGEGGKFTVSGDDADSGLPEPVHSKAAPGEFDTVTADLREEAAILADRAARVEPTVSQALQSLVPEGAELAGFDFRLKKEDRIAEKLADKHAEGLDDDSALGAIADALRYTVKDSTERYTQTTKQTIDELQAAGYRLFKEPKNFWEQGDAYSGINTQWVTPEGLRFELQFHTPESFDTVQQIHADYETYRTSADPEERARLWDSMVQAWEAVPVPEGITEVGKLSRSTAMIAAANEPTHYYVTDQGKYFRRRRDETGQYLEILDDDGTWRDLPSLISYLTGNDSGYEELPGPPPGMQGSVSRFAPRRAAAPSRFARRAYVFDEEAHPRDTGGRFTHKDEGGPYIEPDRSGEPGGVFDEPLTPETVGRWDFGKSPNEPPTERVTPVTLPNRVSLYPDNVQALIDANPRMSGEDDFAYAGRIVQQLDPQSQSDVIYALRETYEPSPVAADGLARWQAENGLDPIPADVLTMRADLDEADEVARFFEQTPDMSDDPEVQAAYDDFKQQNERMYEYMTRPESEGGMGLTVEFTDKTDPYKTAEAQADDITTNRRIVIERGLGGDHSLLTQDEYDRFRAVHDVFGHAAIGGGFDRHGEYQAWLTHAAMYTDPGRQAMSSEYHGVNSAMWSGEPGTPGTGKAVLLPNDYGTPPWERDDTQAEPIAAAADVPDATPPEVAELIRALGLDAEFARKFDHPAWHSEEAMQAAWHGPLGAKAKPDPRLPKVHVASSRFARRAYTFDESAHPRDTSGRFTDSEGGGGSEDDVTAAEAADQFIKGLKVTVDPDEVATFTDRIATFLAKEKAEGREAKLNLCEVSVPGTNLFCGDNQGYTRLEMPQLSGQPVPGSKADRLPKDEDGGVDITGAFTNRLAEMGVDITPEVVPSASLKATQSELRGDKSVGIAQGIRDGKVDIEGGDRIFVSNDGYILDGHHRWAGAILNDFEDGHLGDARMPISRVDMPIRELVDLANEFSQQMGVAAKGTTGDDGSPLSGLAKPRAATVLASQEVDMDTRYIITFPDGRRADSISIGCRVASIPMVASVVAAGDLPVADAATPWDEDAAKQNLLAAAGDDMDAYGRAFLFHDDAQEGPESYYWPIADVVDGQVTVVPAAVDAAMAAINDGTIGTLTPEEKDATVAILSTYSPVPEEDVDAALADQVNAMQAELSAQRARVNAFDEFMDGYLRERTEAQIASVIADEQPLPPFPAEAPLPVA